MKSAKHPTLADSICDTRSRKIKTTFFNQMNTLLDWNTISSLIDKHYIKGKSAQAPPVTMVCYCLKCVYCRLGMD
ncbi:hypothetical protein [Yeosuana sp. AK3]